MPMNGRLGMPSAPTETPDDCVLSERVQATAGQRESRCRVREQCPNSIGVHTSPTKMTDWAVYGIPCSCWDKSREIGRSIEKVQYWVVVDHNTEGREL